MIEGLSRNQLAIGAGVALALCVMVGMVAMSGGAGGDASVRDQVLVNVEQIRQHEIDHKNIFGDYISADSAPRAPHEVTPEPVAWAPSRGFTRLSWEPTAPDAVRGSYSVVVTKDGFTVIGVADGDGDGRTVRIEATASEAARLITAESIY
jgi:hypothetical protein